MSEGTAVKSIDLLHTGLVPTCIGDLEGSLERIDVNECQFRRMVHGIVVQVVDQTDRIGWTSRCRRLPQSAVSENLFDHLSLRRVEKRNDLHFTAALRASQWIYFIDPLDKHCPSLATARMWQDARITLAWVAVYSVRSTKPPAILFGLGELSC